MSDKYRSRWRFCVGLGTGLLLNNWLTSPVHAADGGFPTAVAPALRVLALPECLKIACDHQPNIAAARASLAAAETNLRALEELHVSALLPGGRELPIRRQQAALAVCIAQAALQQAEAETASAVKRNYLTVLYARAQRKVADDLVEKLQVFYEQVIAKKEARGFNPLDPVKIRVYLHLSQARVAEAAAGVERATAALREALGGCPDLCFQVADEGLFQQPPPVPALPCLDDLRSLALARRGEVAQTSTAVDVFALEVDAQSKTCLGPTVRTFASAGDIHSRPVPPHFEDGNLYRPGALVPEMPSILIGSKCLRVERAQDLSSRAGTVADKARNLVVLDLEDVYWRLREAQDKLKAHDGAKDAIELDRLANEIGRGDPEKEGVKAQMSEVIANQVLAAKARAEYTESVYQYYLGLVSLERATAGGFCSGIGGLPPAPLPLSPDTDGKK